MIRVFFWCFLLSLTSTATCAQRHEVGILAGGVNYIGEVGDTNYFNPKQFGYGIIYKRNITQRIALRAQLSTGSFSANDKNATDLVRQSRGLLFSNKYNALGIGIEVNYLDFPIGEFDTSWTPFLHLGVQGLTVDELYFPENEYKAVSHGKKLTLSVPFGAGIKLNLGQYFVIAAEVQPQFTLTDNLDGSSPNTEKQPRSQQFSSSLSSDWLVFTGISITYAFGRLPCCKD